MCKMLQTNGARPFPNFDMTLFILQCAIPNNKGKEYSVYWMRFLAWGDELQLLPHEDVFPGGPPLFQRLDLTILDDKFEN
jgi:hypothetical protein